MPKAIKKKPARPAKKEEDVKNILHVVRESVAGRQKLLLPVFVGAVVVIIAVAGLLIYRSQKNAKAEALQYEAYKIYYGLYQKQQPLQKVESYQKALDKFKEAYETRKSAFSLFYMAHCYYEMGKYDDSLKALNELNKRFPDERFVPLSYYKMAMISLKKGDGESALKFLDAIINYKTGSFKDLALSESAKILDSMGKTEDAARKYEELKKNFPNSPLVKTAQAQPGEKKD